MGGTVSPAEVCWDWRTLWLCPLHVFVLMCGLKFSFFSWYKNMKFVSQFPFINPHFVIGMTSPSFSMPSLFVYRQLESPFLIWLLQAQSITTLPLNPQRTNPLSHFSPHLSQIRIKPQWLSHISHLSTKSHSQNSKGNSLQRNLTLQRL